MMNKDILNKLDHKCNNLAAFHSHCESMTLIYCFHFAAFQLLMSSMKNLRSSDKII